MATIVGEKLDVPLRIEPRYRDADWNKLIAWIKTARCWDEGGYGYCRIEIRLREISELQRLSRKYDSVREHRDGVQYSGNEH